MKRLFSIFAVIMMAVMSLNLNTLSVTAAEPVTYVVKYDDSRNDWNYQVGSEWDSTGYCRELYYMLLDFKDGDYVVIPTEEKSGKTLDLSNFHIGNLTFAPDSSAIVTAKSIKDCYVCVDATGIVNGNVENAYVYDYSTSNFNNDVNYLQHIFDADPSATVGVNGKLGQLYVHKTGYTKYDCYNFTERVLMENGALLTPASAYTNGLLSPVPVTPSTPVTPTAPSAPAADADEYDDVPKTGDSLSFLWAFGFAAICFVGSYSLKKRA